MACYRLAIATRMECPYNRRQATLRRIRACVEVLAQCTRRVAISNGRLLDLVNGQVRLRWRDSKKSPAKRARGFQAAPAGRLSTLIRLAKFKLKGHMGADRACITGNPSTIKPGKGSRQSRRNFLFAGCTEAWAFSHCSLAYSALACFGSGIPGSASFQSVRSSL